MLPPRALWHGSSPGPWQKWWLVQLLNMARRNWGTTGLLNMAMPHLGRLTRPEQRFLKRGFPLTVAEFALFAAARESGLEDPRLVRMAERAKAALEVPPHASPSPGSDVAAAALLKAQADVEEEALMGRIQQFLFSKQLFPWAQVQDFGRGVKWEHDHVVRGNTSAITASVLGYLSTKLVCLASLQPHFQKLQLVAYSRHRSMTNTTHMILHGLKCMNHASLPLNYGPMPPV